MSCWFLVTFSNTNIITVFFLFQTKLSFSLNIISLFWSVVAISLCVMSFSFEKSHNLKVKTNNIYSWLSDLCSSLKHKINVYLLSSFSQLLMQVHEGIKGLIMALLAVEQIIALFLIYWLNKAVCRQHFNILVRLCHSLHTAATTRGIKYFVSNGGYFFFFSPSFCWNRKTEYTVKN